MATKLKSFEQFVSEMDRAEEIEKDIMDMGTADEKGFEEAEEEAEEVQGHGEEDENIEESEEVEESDEEEVSEAFFKKKDYKKDAVTFFRNKGKGGKVLVTRIVKAEDSTFPSPGSDARPDKKNEKEFSHSWSMILVDKFKEMFGEEPKVGQIYDMPANESNEVEEDRAEEIEKEMMDKGTPKPLAEMLAEMYEGACKEEAKAYEEDAHDEHTIESYMKENAALVAGLMAKTLKEMKEEYAIEAYEAACNEMVESYTKKMNEMKEMDSAADAEDAAE